ncbi:MAG TPA: hypothetical protein DGB85_09930 [Deltaproteobacteria bacterium]|nr:hypothetical protein [Deltaproteobacteria bacterium]
MYGSERAIAQDYLLQKNTSLLIQIHQIHFSNVTKLFLFTQSESDVHAGDCMGLNCIIPELQSYLLPKIEIPKSTR